MGVSKKVVINRINVLEKIMCHGGRKQRQLAQSRGFCKAPW